MENKPASLLVVSLDKTLNGMPPSLCGRHVMGPSSLPVVVTPVLLKTCKPSVSANAVYPVHTSSYIMLTTNSSNDKKKQFIKRVSRKVRQAMNNQAIQRLFSEPLRTFKQLGGYRESEEDLPLNYILDGSDCLSKLTSRLKC